MNVTVKIQELWSENGVQYSESVRRSIVALINLLMLSVLLSELKL